MEKNTVIGKWCLLCTLYHWRAGNTHLWSRRRKITQSEVSLCVLGTYPCWVSLSRSHFGCLIPTCTWRKAWNRKVSSKEYVWKDGQKIDLYSVSTKKSPLCGPVIINFLKISRPFLLQLPSACSLFFEPSTSLPTSVPLHSLASLLRFLLPLLVKWDSSFFFMPQMKYSARALHCPSWVLAAFIYCQE